MKKHCDAFMRELGDVPVIACVAIEKKGINRVLDTGKPSLSLSFLPLSFSLICFPFSHQLDYVNRVCVTVTHYDKMTTVMAKMNIRSCHPTARCTHLTLASLAPFTSTSSTPLSFPLLSVCVCVCVDSCESARLLV